MLPYWDEIFKTYDLDIAVSKQYQKFLLNMPLCRAMSFYIVPEEA